MIVRILLLAVVSLPCFGQSRFHQVERATVERRLESVPDRNADREQALARMFTKVGCQPTFEAVKNEKIPNVICILPGATSSAIIVGGHMDHVAYGKGVIDDWSGAALLPTLYQSLKGFPRHHTFVFVGFTEEEKGLVGSKSYVQQMSADAREQAKAMINLECLGMNPTKVWASHADKRLLSELALVAGAMHEDLKAVNVEQVGSADSESFSTAKIPSLTIHSVTQDTLNVLHTRRDNIKAIHPDEYYESYRLVAAYLAILDDTLDRTGGVTQAESEREVPAEQPLSKGARN